MYPHQSLYDPKNSNTYHEVSYGSEKCEAIKRKTKGESNECKYEYRSSDNKFESSGVLSTEAFYLKSFGVQNRKFSDIVFGCDHTHKGNFKHGVQAVVGLGQGSKLSLVSQLGKEIGEKFSYCLPMQSVSDLNKIRFGSDIKLYNRDIEFKAKITYDSPYAFHYLSLEAISITINGKKRKIRVAQHLMRVDIQTAVTTFPPTIYNQLLNAFKEEAGNIKSFKHQEYGTCFHKSSFSGRIPKLVFHFKARLGSNADLHLQHKNFLLDYEDMQFAR
ncbi:aspartic proteinase CDR1-like [Tripterygium wilfordii]|uniref:aspartic proteinase CDR1-like n=1 Tax=Tripterygium wilfordii TaxID=458696 RepID=UPI0018F80516|nr:aspartic proteinase CDR1-like [Tripterygium wilfordii]